MPPSQYPDATRDEPDDPYRWLEDAAAPQTRRWVAEQDVLVRAEHTDRPATRHWHARVDALGTVDRVMAPKVRGGRIFALRQHAGQEHPALVVADGGDERVLLDPSVLDPAGRTTLEAWQPSTTGALLAYQTSRDGTEDALLYVLDVATGQLVDGPIDRIRGGTIGWLPDDEQLYYIRCLPPGPDGGHRRYHRRVWLHKVGSATDTDALVFGDGRSKAQFYTVAVTADGRWLTITAAEGTSPAADVFLADLTTAGSPSRPMLRLVQEAGTARSRPHVVADTAPDGPMWWRTDGDAPYGRVVVCTPARPAQQHWRTLVAQRPGAVLTDFAVLRGPGLVRPLGLAAWLRHSTAEITVHDLADGRPTGTVALPGTGTVGSIAVRPEGGHEAWFGYTDFGTPPQVLHYDAVTGATDVWACGRDLGTDVRTRVEVVISRDGTPVRLFVVSQTGRPDWPRPTILHAYGGFGVSVSPKFSPEVLTWVAAGGVFAVACVRGGGDEGEQWHRAGCREHKQNTFDDATAAAQHLLATGWTEPGRLGIMGISNGGLLVGVAVTQQPGLYAAAVCMSPLLDMARFEFSGLGASWVPEYGSAADPAQRRTLLSYSPYHNVRAGTAYPAVLFTVADGDTRVDPLHARKMCAALQHATTGAGPILFWLERGVGHGSRAASRRSELYGHALAFLGAHLGLPAPPDGA